MWRIKSLELSMSHLRFPILRATATVGMATGLPLCPAVYLKTLLPCIIIVHTVKVHLHLRRHLSSTHISLVSHKRP